MVVATGTDITRGGILPVLSSSLIKGNKVSGCVVGFSGIGPKGLNVIGNTVDAASGTKGFDLADDYSNLLDQNTVTGDGTHYNPSSFSKAAWRNNY